MTSVNRIADSNSYIACLSGQPIDGTVRKFVIQDFEQIESQTVAIGIWVLLYPTPTAGPIPSFREGELRGEPRGFPTA